MKRLGVAILAYVQDYEETYPNRGDYNVAGVPSWRQRILPYTKNLQIYQCPSNPNRNQDANMLQTTAGYNAPIIKRYYGASGWYMGDGGTTGQKSLSDVAKPAQKILLGEVAGANWTDWARPGWTTTNWDQGFAKHLSQENYLFGDGHVKSYKPSQTATPFNMWGSTNTAGAAGTCGTGDINCDQVDSNVLAGQKALEAKCP